MEEQVKRIAGRVSNLEWIAASLLLVLIYWTYYPALELPPALIDDVVALANFDRMIFAIQHGDLGSVINNDISLTSRTYNLGFSLLTTLKLWLTGGKPFHWLKLLELAFVCSLMFAIIRQTLPCKKLAGIAGLFSVFVFTICNALGGFDLQGLRTNWFRLYATDADGIIFMAIHIYCIVQGLRTRQAWHGSLWAISAALSGLIAVSIKIPYVALLVGPLVVVGLIALRSIDRHIALKSAFIASILALQSLAYYLFLRSSANRLLSSPDAYGESVVFTPEALLEGWRYYTGNFWDLYGPLLPGLVGLACISTIRFWHRRYVENLPFLMFCYFVTFTALGIFIYMPWLNRLWRYMLVSHFGFSVVAGFALYSVVDELRTRDIRLPVLILAIGTGCIAAFLPPVLLWVFVASAVVLFFYKRVLALAFHAGLAIVGLAYIAFQVPLARSALNYSYVEREKANWQATMDVLKHSANEHTVYFAGDTADEHIGSMAGHIARLGTNPKIETVRSNMPRTSSSIVLVHIHLSPPQAVADREPARLIADINIPKSQFDVPVSFWEFRRRLLAKEKSPALTHDTWDSETVWRLYGY